MASSLCLTNGRSLPLGDDRAYGCRARFGRHPRFWPAFRCVPAVTETGPSPACGWLPQLEPVAFGVHRPAEAAVVALLDRVDHLHPGGPQLGEHGVEVEDAVVQHAGLLLPAEVRRVALEHRPGGRATV